MREKVQFAIVDREALSNSAARLHCVLRVSWKNDDCRRLSQSRQKTALLSIADARPPVANRDSAGILASAVSRHVYKCCKAYRAANHFFEYCRRTHRPFRKSPSDRFAVAY